jgi:hypothetical protein
MIFSKASTRFVDYSVSYPHLTISSQEFLIFMLVKCSEHLFFFQNSSYNHLQKKMIHSLSQTPSWKHKMNGHDDVIQIPPPLCQQKKYEKEKFF